MTETQILHAEVGLCMSVETNLPMADMSPRFATNGLHIEHADFEWLRTYLLRDEARGVAPPPQPTQLEDEDEGESSETVSTNGELQLVTSPLHGGLRMLLKQSSMQSDDTVLSAQEDDDDDDDAEGSVEQGAYTRRRKVGWTSTEDLAILATVRRLGTQWNRIAAQLPGRTSDAVRNRWHRLQKTHSLGDSEEGRLALDALLLACGIEPDWAPPSDPREVKKVDAVCVKGAVCIKGADHGRAMWTSQEDTMIEEGVHRFGLKWRQIAASLPGRSDSSVRNRWMRLQKEHAAASGSPSSPMHPEPPKLLDYSKAAGAYFKPLQAIPVQVPVAHVATMLGSAIPHGVSAAPLAAAVCAAGAIPSVLLSANGIGVPASDVAGLSLRRSGSSGPANGNAPRPLPPTRCASMPESQPVPLPAQLLHLSLSVQPVALPPPPPVAEMPIPPKMPMPPKADGPRPTPFSSLKRRLSAGAVAGADGVRCGLTNGSGTPLLGFDLMQFVDAVSGAIDEHGNVYGAVPEECEADETETDAGELRFEILHVPEMHASRSDRASLHEAATSTTSSAAAATSATSAFASGTDAAVAVTNAVIKTSLALAFATPAPLVALSAFLTGLVALSLGATLSTRAR